MQTERENDLAREETQHAPPQAAPPPELPPASPRKAVVIVVMVLVVLALCGAASMLSRFRSARALAKESEIESVATVVVVHPVEERPDEELVLPASLQAYEESPIYARTSGYLLRWYKDIGSRVNKGELPLYRALAPNADERLIREFVLQMKLGHVTKSYFAEKFQVDVEDRFAAPLGALRDGGYLTTNGGSNELTLSRPALLRVDGLLHEFFLPEHRTDRIV